MSTPFCNNLSAISGCSLKYNSSSSKFELEASLVPEWGNFGGAGYCIAVDGKSLMVGSPLNVNFENVFSGFKTFIFDQILSTKKTRKNCRKKSVKICMK